MFKNVTYNTPVSLTASCSMLTVVNACDKACVYRGLEQAETDTEDKRLSTVRQLKKFLHVISGATSVSSEEAKHIMM